MHDPELVHIFTAPLEVSGLDYLITGSVACAVYGEPRMTHDIDIVLALSPRDAVLIEAAFPLDRFYYPPPEVIRMEAGRAQRGHFKLIHHETGFKADIYLKANAPLHAWAMQHRRSVDLPGGRIALAPLST